MNFFKKIHKLVGQNEYLVKKPQRHDANLQKNSTLYFQVGLILCLLASYGLFEMNFEPRSIIIDRPFYPEPEDVYVFNDIVKIYEEEAPKEEKKNLLFLMIQQL